MKNTSSSVHEAIALRRLSLVQQIIELIQQHWPLSAALEQVASAHPLPGDSDAPPQFVAQRTLEDWYYAFRKGGFEGLKPKSRSDRGKPRRLSAQQQQAWLAGALQFNQRRIADYPKLSSYLRRLYEMPGVAETVNLVHIKGHYYQSHRTINPGIVPLGPEIKFT
jgi:hypothetical protein